MDDLRRAISSGNDDDDDPSPPPHRPHHNTAATLGEILGVSAEKICPRIVSDHRHRRPDHLLDGFPLFDHHNVRDQPDIINDDDDDHHHHRHHSEHERVADKQQQDGNVKQDEKIGKGEAEMVVRKTTLGISGLRWSVMVATGLDSFSPS